MSKDILDPSIPNDGNSVDLGGGQIVSMKAVQQIYSEITGRTESLERSYKFNHSIGFDDLCQLDAKVTQLLEQYNIVSRNCSVTLFHLDDQKQTFSSFERFKLFDRTTLSPVENVRIEYNFLIILPQMRRPQSYKIEVNIHSRAAMVKRANGDTGMRNTIFYEFFSPNTAHLEIEYVDYTVARNFQGAIDGWFKALPEQDTGWLLTPLKKLTGYYVFAFRFTLVTAFLYSCYAHFSETLGNVRASQVALFQAATVTFGGMLLMSILSGKFGSVAAEAVKRVQCKSYVNLTRGDEIAFKGMNASNRLSWLKASGSLVLAVGGKVLAAYIVTKIGIAP
ncbi:hypothetical protein PWG14_24015 [Chromobacterium amazonense]|uniref:hypothetical protein n=1 Tax=Chromobacterium amazonense TaxID=1382803 RepID=UPI00237D7E73|nr:hypothetical protein [Chromobacterium amazonense]MDE1715533.1 hypothetical protein [Chromobacterium amazonense]